MNIRLPNIKISTFYLVGGILMIISVLAGIWNAYSIWPLLSNWGAKINSLTSIFFNLLWMALFFFLYKNTPDMPMNTKVIESPEIDDLLKELKEKEVKNGKK